MYTYIYSGDIIHVQVLKNFHCHLGFLEKCLIVKFDIFSSNVYMIEWLRKEKNS